MKVLSTISGTTTGGRSGHGESSDGLLKVDFSGKPEAKLTPEHLFAVGYTSCFGSALQAVAGQQKKSIGTDFSVTAEVKLIMGDDHGYSLEVALAVKIPQLDAAEAKTLVEAAHQVCPYSKAIHGNVPVTLSVL